jgi:serine-type D-Ala-D-Ala carboxypeptidase (penicillin-binding protein 5/6)
MTAPGPVRSAAAALFSAVVLAAAVLVTGLPAARALSPRTLPPRVLTVQQLLNAMLLPSGCDAALALAKAYGPGRHAFVRTMNATARRLGMRRTRFSNFDGLPLPTEHSTYSTPRNLIALGRAAMKLAAFRRIVHHGSRRLVATADHHAYFWRNTNLLLGSYPGALGIKTGRTGAAGYCLLFEAAHGSTLIGVVLHSFRHQPVHSLPGRCQAS